jgi:hypothetical protein
LLHLIHHGQCAGFGADDEPTASPGDVLFDGEQRVAEVLTELLGWFLLALVDLPLGTRAKRGTAAPLRASEESRNGAVAVNLIRAF